MLFDDRFFFSSVVTVVGITDKAGIVGDIFCKFITFRISNSVEVRRGNCFLDGKL